MLGNGGKPSWEWPELVLLLLLLLLDTKRPKLLQKHVTLSAQTAATGSLWDLSAFIAAGILRAFALKLTLACGFPLCFFLSSQPFFSVLYTRGGGYLFRFMQLHLNVMVMSQLASPACTQQSRECEGKFCHSIDACNVIEINAFKEYL